MKTITTIILILAAALPSCGYLETIFEEAQDPAIVELSARLTDEVDNYNDLKQEYAALSLELAILQDSLAKDGLTIENTEKVLDAMQSMTVRVGLVQGAIDHAGGTITAIKNEIDEREQGPDGLPWWVTLASVVLAAAAPTMNTIPIVGRIMGSKIVAKTLEEIGFRNEKVRAESRTSV